MLNPYESYELYGMTLEERIAHREDEEVAKEDRCTLEIIGDDFGDLQQDIADTLGWILEGIFRG